MTENRKRVSEAEEEQDSRDLINAEVEQGMMSNPPCGQTLLNVPFIAVDIPVLVWPPHLQHKEYVTALSFYSC